MKEGIPAETVIIFKFSQMRPVKVELVWKVVLSFPRGSGRARVTRPAADEVADNK